MYRRHEYTGSIFDNVRCSILKITKHDCAAKWDKTWERESVRWLIVRVFVSELIDTVFTSHVVASLRTTEDLDTFQQMRDRGSQVRDQHKSRPSQYLYA